MPIMRATFFYEDINKHGWTENWYNFDATTPADMLPKAQQLAPYRVSMLATGARLIKIRCSDDLIKRDSKIIKVSSADGSGGGYSGSAAADADYTVLASLFPVDATKRGHVFLSGVPQDYIREAGQWEPKPDWVNAFSSFKAQLIRNHWAVRNKTGTVPVRNIVGWVQDLVSGNVTITTNPDHGFAQGDGVIIRGTGFPALTGSFTVLAPVTVNKFDVHLSTILGPFIGAGTVSKTDFALYTINDAIYSDGGNRKRGRFTNSPVGRRRAR